MKNCFGCVSLLLLLVLGACVFGIAQRMHQAQSDYAQLTHDIAQEADHLRVLQAEWTYLNNPDRLEKLAAGFGLQPQDGKQYVATADLPTQTAMRDVALAQDDTSQSEVSAPQNAVRHQQLLAATLPSDTAKVDRVLTLAGATAPAPALPAPLNVSLTSDGVE